MLIHGRTTKEWKLENARRAIAAGETPFRFWFGQVTIGLDMVAKRSGVDRERLLDLDRGDGQPSQAEAEALAPILRCDASDLMILLEDQAGVRIGGVNVADE